MSTILGGIPHIYSAREAHIVGDVGQSIRYIYATLDNSRHITEMDGKLCDQVVSILIGLGSNYSNVNPDFVDKCGFNK